MTQKLATKRAALLGSWAVSIVAVTAPSAFAGQVDVRVHGVANAKGAVRVAICDKSEFLKQCHILGDKIASRGDVIVRFANVPAGHWAVMVYHDENNDKRLEKNPLGIPTEGNGLSRNAKGHFGPPKFEDAVIDVPKPPIAVDVTVSY
jgi:uncharacterized protein (DUF2141 family)